MLGHVPQLGEALQSLNTSSICNALLAAGRKHDDVLASSGVPGLVIISSCSLCAANADTPLESRSRSFVPAHNRPANDEL
jgi:hypothetical protein